MAVQDNMTSDAKGLEASSAEKRRRLADKVRFRSNKVHSLRGDHHSDEESNEEVQESETPDLKRQLKDRHLQMIAIGQYLILCGEKKKNPNSDQEEQLEPVSLSAAERPLHTLAQPGP
jgi:hypothetical protein